jgi:hypothetical protein
MVHDIRNAGLFIFGFAVLAFAIYSLCFEGIRYEIKAKWSYRIFVSWICWGCSVFLGYAALGQEVLTRGIIVFGSYGTLIASFHQSNANGGLC